MPNLPARAPIGLRQRVVDSLTDRSIVLLLLFWVLWSSLLLLFYFRQKSDTLAQISQSRRSEIHSAFTRLNAISLQSLLLIDELDQYLQPRWPELLRGQGLEPARTLLEQEVARSSVYMRVQVMDAGGQILLDVDNVSQSVSFATDGYPKRVLWLESLPEVQPGGVFVSDVYAAQVDWKGESINAALSDAIMRAVDPQGNPLGTVVMTFGFCPCDQPMPTSNIQILTGEGVLLKTRVRNGETLPGFEIMDFAGTHPEIWKRLENPTEIVRHYPERGGFSLLERSEGVSLGAELWKSYFSEIQSEPQFYLVAPVLPEDFRAPMLLLKTRLSGIALAIGILALWVHVLLVIKNRSERESREQLLDQRRFLDSLLQAIPFPIVYLDRDGQRIGTNREMQTRWCQLESSGGKLCDQCRSDGWRLCEKVMQGIRDALGSEELQSIREFGHHSQAGSRQYRLHTARYADREGEVAGAIGVLVDVSHFKEHEIRLAEAKTRADRANQAKGAFLATMSHEIRTPLNGIIGMSSLMSDTPLDETQLEYVETIKASGETLLSLINDILDFSKIEADRIELERIPLNVENIVCDILDMLSKQAHLEDVDLVYRMEPGVQTEILGDPVRLKQVITNLVSNAIKFTEKGSIVVSIASEPGSAGRLRIAVTDTGIGLDADRIGTLFEPFVQADSSTTRRFGGTGLGLAISKRLVTAMGGELTVNSQPGEGSVFEFDLPTRISRATSQPDNSQVRILSDLTVLLVDDNAQSLRIVKEILEDWKMEVAAFSDPSEALEWLTTGHHCDAVLADHLMPGMDGETFCMHASRYLRGRERLTPLLLMCSLEHQPNLEWVTKVIRKPIHRSRVLEVLVNVMSRQPQGIPKIVIHGNKRPTLVIAEQFPLRILIAEDNKVNQRVVKLLLKKLGYEGDFVENGLQAVKAYTEAYDRDPYDIVLMDIQMPIMDGITAGGQIRALEAGKRECCIIALSANVLDETRSAAIDIGFNDYLCKPVKFETLKVSMEKAWNYLNRLSADRREAEKGRFFTAELPSKR